MNFIQSLINEMEREAKTTANMLSRVPADKLDWQPHSKSMNIKALASHIAEIPSWVQLSLETDVLDFAESPYTPPAIESVQDLLDLHQQSVSTALNSLRNTNESVLDENWTMKNGNHIIAVMSKEESVRHGYSQTVHHRAQLGVYFRLLGIAVPPSYGPSADEGNM